jgi:Insertion element 4 transposase N-terminal/Transposase DDE domain
VDQSVISCAVPGAAGRFAPGHLGELTQQVPFEMVDAVLAETRRVQRRVRDLPARVVVYLVLAGCLFPEAGYTRVWDRLAAGLPGPAARPTAGALRQARARLGPEPLRALFALLKGPAAVPAGMPGVRWRGLLPVAVDGTVMTVADTPANLAVYSRQKGGPCGDSGYPLLRLVALVSCGTRSVIDAAFGPASAGEIAYACCLLGGLRAGMLLLADRGFGYGILAAQVAATGAGFLLRVRTGKSTAKLPVMARCGDGSWLSLLGGVRVRVIDAEVTLTTSAGSSSGRCLLVTTLLDPARYPAGELVALYRQRWEVEIGHRWYPSSCLVFS